MLRIIKIEIRIGKFKNHYPFFLLFDFTMRQINEINVRTKKLTCQLVSLSDSFSIQLEDYCRSRICISYIFIQFRCVFRNQEKLSHKFSFSFRCFVLFLRFIPSFFKDGGEATIFSPPHSILSTPLFTSVVNCLFCVCSEAGTRNQCHVNDV